ncbi:hypothetical protein [Robiginitalea sp. IMCC43444]|uniref:hypothetical protein n=1 Tax=Robiginitalea sp. IMCC43444 TaxID=3459121 RepID=UPI0040419CB3
MRKTIRYLVLLIVLASLGSIAYGFSLDADSVMANKYIGFGVIGLFLVAMPIFLWSESRGKKMKDYMLTDENLKKMRNRNGKTSQNQ